MLNKEFPGSMPSRNREKTRDMAYSVPQAADLSTRVLIELVDRPQDLARFMDQAGLRPKDLRDIATRPEVALFLLDFLVEDDDRILSFAQALHLRPQDIMAARTALSGPGSYGWEAD